MDKKIKRLKPKTEPEATEPAKKKIKLIYSYYLPAEIWRMIVAYLTKVRDRVHVILTNHTHLLAIQTENLHEKMKRSAFVDLVINYGMPPPPPSNQPEVMGSILSKLYDTMGKPPDAEQAYCLESAIDFRRDVVRHERTIQSEGADRYNLWIVASDVEKYTTPRKPTIINIVGGYHDTSTKACLIICHGIHPKRIVMKWKLFNEPTDVFKEFAVYLKNLCLGLGMIFNPSDFKYHFKWRKRKKSILPLDPEGLGSCMCSTCSPESKLLTYQ